MLFFVGCGWVLSPSCVWRAQLEWDIPLAMMVRDVVEVMLESAQVDVLVEDMCFVRCVCVCLLVCLCVCACARASQKKGTGSL